MVLPHRGQGDVIGRIGRIGRILNLLAFHRVGGGELFAVVAALDNLRLHCGNLLGCPSDGVGRERMAASMLGGDGEGIRARGTG